MAIERQELLMGSGVFFNACVLVIDILVEAFSPQGQRLLNIAHPSKMVNSISPMARLMASQLDRFPISFK